MFLPIGLCCMKDIVFDNLYLMKIHSCIHCVFVFCEEQKEITVVITKI